MDTISIIDVIIPEHHRAIKPWHLAHLTEKIKRDGFNTSYPITIEEDGTLVDGRHRLEAARANGLAELPYALKPEGVSIIRHSLRCNADGQDCAADDVFDLAELCWELAQQGWIGEQIADELGWRETASVTNHKNIRTKLHPSAWELARNSCLANGQNGSVANHELAIANWRETYFRTLFEYLPYENGNRATMREQVRVIQSATARFADPKNKVTAKWIGEIAECHAWHLRLMEYMRDNLVKDVPLSDWRMLLTSIRKNAFGDKAKDANLERFTNAVNALNERILGVRLYQDDALQRIPLLEDKLLALVIADPPYNVTDNEWDKIGSPEEYLAWLKGWLDSLRPKLRDDYHLFLFCSPDYQADIEMLLRRDEWPLKSRIVWEHRNLVSGREVTDKYVCDWEMVFHCGTHPLNFPPDWNDTRFQVKEYARPQSNFEDKSYHPTSKPLALIELFIQHGSKPGDVVLDPFAGGGTTGAACSRVGQRRCILVEKADDYCSTIEGRLGIKRTVEVIE